LAGYTADLIRLNRPDEVLNLLQPVARDPRRGGFLVFAHLARAHAGRGEWREARDQQQQAVRYAEFPTSFARLTKPQLAWLKRVEREYYLPFLAHRAEEARGGRRSSLREDVDPLFPAAVPPKRPDNPVRFVGEDGTYAAGKLASAERAKLPPDAIALVQQLLLWHPKDARLYWLLGELYNAEGEIDVAARLLDACTFNMGYSNPVVIEHRRVLKSAADAASAARAAEAEKARADMEADQARRDQAERDYQQRFWWIIAVGVALGVLLLYYQFRELIRRVRRPDRDS
jgi:tetratricopeptide (TPR) repeat protein